MDLDALFFSCNCDYDGTKKKLEKALKMAIKKAHGDAWKGRFLDSELRLLEEEETWKIEIGPTPKLPDGSASRAHTDYGRRTLLNCSILNDPPERLAETLLHELGHRLDRQRAGERSGDTCRRSERNQQIRTDACFGRPGSPPDVRQCVGR